MVPEEEEGEEEEEAGRMDEGVSRVDLYATSLLSHFQIQRCFKAGLIWSTCVQMCMLISVGYCNVQVIYNSSACRPAPLLTKRGTYYSVFSVLVVQYIASLWCRV